MSNIKEYLHEKYMLSAAVGSGLVAGVSGLVIGATAGGFMGLTGIAIGGATFAAATLFRSRTDEEITELLARGEKAPAVELTGGDKASDSSTRKGAGRYLMELMDKVLAQRTALGNDVVNSANPIFENLYEILKKWTKLEGMAEVQYTVEAILYDYLPATLEGYLNVSAENRKVNDTKLKAELIEQLNILAAETQRIKDGLYREEMKVITTQSNFLKSRFAGNDSSGKLAINQ